MEGINLNNLITGLQAKLYQTCFFSQMFKLFLACIFSYFLLLATDYVFVYVFHDWPQKERLFHLLQFSCNDFYS